jgi:V/A-type H+-transporting ATPase subunit D
MSAERVIATRHQLLETKKQLDVVLNIRHILEDRKDIYLDLVKKAIDEIQVARQKMYASLSGAYDRLALSAMTMGRERLDEILPQLKTLSSLKGYTRRVVGMEIYGVMLESVSIEKNFGFLETSTFLDEFLEKMQVALKDVIRVAEAETLLFKLVEDLQNTQRLINILDQVVIPRYQKIINSIDSRLEEDDREELIRLKIIEKRISNKNERRIP